MALLQVKMGCSSQGGPLLRQPLVVVAAAAGRSWWVHRAYRARAVRDPRGLLAEFGTVLPEGTAVPRARLHSKNVEYDARDALPEVLELLRACPGSSAGDAAALVVCSCSVRVCTMQQLSWNTVSAIPD